MNGSEGWLLVPEAGTLAAGVDWPHGMSIDQPVAGETGRGFAGDSENPDGPGWPADAPVIGGPFIGPAAMAGFDGDWLGRLIGPLADGEFQGSLGAFAGPAWGSTGRFISEEPGLLFDHCT